MDVAFESIVVVCVDALLVYAAVGVAFAIWFVSLGVTRLDEQSRGSGVPFRLIIVPGVVALWPVLARRVLRHETEPPIERTPHR
jgi:hypothetical protein